MSSIEFVCINQISVGVIAKMDYRHPEHSSGEHTAHADIFSVYGDVIWIILGVFLLILFFVVSSL